VCERKVVKKEWEWEGLEEVETEEDIRMQDVF